MNLRELQDGSVLMRDLETDSTWVQASGEAIDGPLEGSRLEILGCEITSLGRWMEDHPDSTLYGVVRGVDSASERVLWDSARTRSMALVVKVGESVRAYPTRDVVDAGGVLEDELDGVPLAVVYSPESFVMAAFDRRTERGTAHLRAEPGESGELRLIADLLDEPLDPRSGRAHRATARAPGTKSEAPPGLSPIDFHPMLLERFSQHYPEGMVFSAK